MMTDRFFLPIAAALMLAGCDTAPSTKESATNESDHKVATVENSLPEQVSFNEHIQPILSEYCYHCHGPDAKTRAPKDEPLRLDRPEDAFMKRSGGQAVIVKGRPEDSALIQRIRAKEQDLVMPPPESHKQLSARQIALLEQWIRQGAVYEPHWSFAPIHRVDPPHVDSPWVKTPIDAFIAQALGERKLAPAVEDEPSRFHRRMTLDLTGLPPPPEETAAFVEAYAQRGQQAVEAEADRLMATEASAEHFARQWLDVARYADTHGIHIDNRRAIWPYRDWVIGAFRANMPWDQFTLEQIAGDLLPDRTLDQRVASGFNRCMATTGEGGAISEEYEAIYAKDQVETMSAAWLGLTTGCAACHDHKFDPISTREFYSLTAFFRNTTMDAMDRNDANHPPSLFVPAVDERERWETLQKEIALQESRIRDRAQQAEPELKAWLASPKLFPDPPVGGGLELYLPLAASSGSLSGWTDGAERKWNADYRRTEGLIGKAMRVGGGSIELGDLTRFSRSSQFTLSVYLRVKGKPSAVLLSRMEPSPGERGWSLGLNEGRVVFRAVDTKEEAESRILSNDALEPGQWHHVVVTFDGTAAGHEALSLKLNGKRMAGKTDPNTVGGRIEAEAPLRLGASGPSNNAAAGSIAMQDLRIYRRLLDSGEIEKLAHKPELVAAATTAPAKRSADQQALLKTHFLRHVDRSSLELLTRLEALRCDEREIRSRGSMTLVMEEKPEPAFAHVLNRGVYSDKGEKVTPATPAVLPPMPENAPRNRLGLARWLNDPHNPLPARVVMNRAWSYLFGNGIVETNSDFGIMGARPSHPKLLDWLADEFIASKWNYRHMIRLMVSSATYRQSGRVTADKLENDPTNVWLSRGPRCRLDAEVFRDMALAASGLLSPRVGGPPVKPYQPEGIWEAVAMPQSNTKSYVPDHGEALYRRSIYTFWKRSAPPPSMEILNAPTRETFCVRRERTNTPLQALVVLNDPQFIEACRVLATHALHQSVGFDERLDAVTRALASRVFNPSERAVVRRSLEESLKSYRNEPSAAAALIEVGETPADSKLDAAELASWTLIASQVMNLDETLTR